MFRQKLFLCWKPIHGLLRFIPINGNEDIQLFRYDDPRNNLMSLLLNEQNSYWLFILLSSRQMKSRFTFLLRFLRLDLIYIFFSYEKPNKFAIRSCNLVYMLPSLSWMIWATQSLMAISTIVKKFNLVYANDYKDVIFVLYIQCVSKRLETRTLTGYNPDRCDRSRIIFISHEAPFLPLSNDVMWRLNRWLTEPLSVLSLVPSF